MNGKKMEVIREFYAIRFGDPASDTHYFEQWVNRFRGLENGQIPIQMDLSSRRAYGKASGLRYAVIKYNYTQDPVFSIVDLKTGLESNETSFSKAELMLDKIRESLE